MKYNESESERGSVKVVGAFVWGCLRLFLFQPRTQKLAGSTYSSFATERVSPLRNDR